MNLPKLAIFDMDGLLFDTERLFMEKKAFFLEKYGYPSREEDYVKTLGTSGEQLKNIQREIYGPDYPSDLITRETRAVVNEHINVHGPGIKPGIPELLESLTRNNVVCCVASSTDTDIVKKYLKMADILKYFEYIIGGDQVSHSKPDPEIFLKAFSKRAFEKSDTLIFEDSENGIRAAKAAGIPVICIVDMKYPEDSLRNIPLHIVSNAYEALQLFDDSI